MFNKKPRRNFRQRKASSSDEEDEQKNSGHGEETEKAPAVLNKPFNVDQGRGVSKRDLTSSKPDSSDEEDEVTSEVVDEVKESINVKDGMKNKIAPCLSFSEDKEGWLCFVCDVLK